LAAASPEAARTRGGRAGASGLDDQRERAGGSVRSCFTCGTGRKLGCSLSASTASPRSCVRSPMRWRAVSRRPSEKHSSRLRAPPAPQPRRSCARLATPSSREQPCRSGAIARPRLSDSGSRWPCSGRRDRDSLQSLAAAPSSVWRSRCGASSRPPTLAGARPTWSPDPTAILVRVVSSVVRDLRRSREIAGRRSDTRPPTKARLAVGRAENPLGGCALELLTGGWERYTLGARSRPVGRTCGQLRQLHISRRALERHSR
jgi:hypothetical protein